MHPHRLRHTLATQAINRGMRLEAIAALLGHRSLEMTLVYAKITDRVVADEYASVREQIDALYGTANTPGALPAEIETAAMARLRQEPHARMLGNGMCTRPIELDCRMETICMLTWWPTARIARAVARWVGGRDEPDDSDRPVDGSST
jgi:Phage integrase family